MANHEREGEIGMQLACRAYFYSLMHVVFGSEPTIDTVGHMLSQRSADVLAACAAECAGESAGERAGDLPAQAASAASALEAICAASGRDTRALTEALASDYSMLFLVPGQTYVRMWESPYTGKEGMVFQESTLDVRKRYHAAGFKLQAEKKFPDDHLAAMMDFMGRLGQRAYDAFADGRDDELATVLGMQCEFIDLHILTWIDDFAAAVAIKDGDGLYAAFAVLAAAFVRRDRVMAEAIAHELQN